MSETVESIIKALRAELKHLKQPMACTHLRANWEIHDVREGYCNTCTAEWEPGFCDGHCTVCYEKLCVAERVRRCILSVDLLPLLKEPGWPSLPNVPRPWSPAAVKELIDEQVVKPEE